MTKALLVCGGPSGKSWKELHDQVNPDILMGVNGVVNEIKTLDYWLCVENMTKPAQWAEEGKQRYIDIMKILDDTSPRVRLINSISLKFVKDLQGVVPVDRHHYELEDFSFRKYGEGLLQGDMMNKPEYGVPLYVGTVALQAIHFLGTLGVDEIHSIGIDLTGKNHWYEYPEAAPSRFYTEAMFTNYMGHETLWLFVESARYLQKIRPYLERDGIEWVDHSNGLLQVKG